MDVRAREFHGDRMWSWRWVKAALDFAAANGLNALVFHKNDLLDLLALPERYFSVDDVWRRWPVRYHNIDNNRQYIRSVARYAHDRGIRFFAEVKEISFHDSLLAQRPELWVNGGIDTATPFWWEFLEAKVSEVVEAVPEIDGIIVSPGTRESRVSISTTQTSTKPGLSAADWYEALIGAMYRPLARAGKVLAVRDFTYTQAEQSVVLDAVSRVSDQIVISLKNTPHDYYPTFPNNARIGHVGRNPQWIEFDTWGQFFGLGVFPAIVLDDMRERFAYARKQGAIGVMARTDWEVISDNQVLDTLNLPNLMGFTKLASGSDIDVSDVVGQFLGHSFATALGGGVEIGPFSLDGAPRTKAALARALNRSWEMMSKAVFVLRHVFHEDCMFPDTLKKAYMMLVEVHGIADWAPEMAGALDLTPEKLHEIFAEKDEAVALAREMSEEIAGATAAEQTAAAEELRETYDLQLWYAEGFRACARACFAAKWALTTPEDADRQKSARSEIDALEQYRLALVDRLSGTRYCHLVYWLLDTHRLESLHEDLERSLGAFQL
jgi:hypothetical protein